METGRTALLVFYGLFWAAVISAVSRYRAFDTAAFFSRRREQSCHAIYRFTASFVILNILPILWLWLLYTEIVPHKCGWLPVMGAAFASLSVFGFNRILHATIATPTTYSRFYSYSDWKAVVEQQPWRPLRGPDNSFKAGLYPGLFYLAIPTFLGRIIGNPLQRGWIGLGVVVVVALLVLVVCRCARRQVWRILAYPVRRFSRFFTIPQ
jgi:hypothetical protein